MDVIRITLRSDLCAGNGESRGNAVDIDIVLTADGLPRIPARRLKGCLRAAAEELAALGDETAAYTAELFGDKAGRQGCLWVGDAALPQEAAFTAWLKQNPAWADHSRVEQLYTDVRGQTRLQDGVADDGSLRFTRVLGQYDPLDKAKALVFEAPVRLENASHEAMCLLEHCCAATRHIGTHRNRGLGNVRLTYIPGTDTPTAPQKPPLPDADTVTLTYHVQLKTPLTLPGCGKQLTDTDWADPRVQVLCLPENVGFGRGHNAVLGKLHSSVHFILNPDIVLTGDILQPMAEWLLAQPGAAMATPQLHYPDGRLQHLPRRKPTPWLLLARQLAPKFGGAFKKADDHYTMQDEDLTAPRRIEFCTGSFMAVRTDVLQKIGGFDPAYFMYVEDADLTQKVLREGTVWLAPQFHAVHAWHRAPMRDAGKFKMQLVSMGRYFKKWGCGKGSV